MSGQGRLLPWSGENGQRAYLVTDNSGGFLSRLADGLEETQLDTGEVVLGHVRRMLENPLVSARELRYAVARLSECLTDALRVAESRGARLMDAEDSEA